MNASSVCIVCSDPARKVEATTLARKTGLPLIDHKSNEFELALCFERDYTELFDSGLNTGIHVDFAKGALAHRRQFGGGRGQAIARAIGLKHGNNPDVIDITAGLARDAYILASLGCKVTLVEQSIVLYTLLQDGILRGLANEASANVLKNFINLVHADSVVYLRHLDRQTRPALIYIDPMYPERKKTALVKKDMQILQHLLGEDENAPLLLKTALESTASRVVVKRPVHAAPVDGIKPSTSISSKKTRYDVYLVNS